MYHSAAAVCADLAGAGVAVVECPLAVAFRPSSEMKSL